MKLSKTKIGPFELYSIQSGFFRLDGGAMFGVVPKTLWSRAIEADEKNRIPMGMRCLLIKSGNTGKIYLVDNGIGTKFDEKMSKIYAVDHETVNLKKSLQYHGFQTSDITDIIFTHLHFDHCGGSTYYDNDGTLKLTFPGAAYHITKKHWETAVNPNAREKASFFEENLKPLSDSGNINFVSENHQYEEGLSAIPVNGHTLGQQLPVIESEGKTIVYMGDLIPTHVHVPLPWIMGYDMYPVQTLLEKENFLSEAAENDWYLYLEHDAREEVITVNYDGKKYSVNKTMTLTDI